MRSLTAGLMALALMVCPAVAETPRQITWDDLVPAGPMLLDPSTPLNNSQRADLYKVESIREREKRGSISKISPEYDDAVVLTRKLKKQGLDVDALLAALAEFDAEIVRRNQAVVGALEGQLIRMPGYALPLEFSGGEMKEFLLVPFIGACIHVPPPPPNQVVFVKLNEGFTAKDLYTPVWITGRMTINRASKSLSLVDGQSDVEMAYSIEGIRVELYKR